VKRSTLLSVVARVVLALGGLALVAYLVRDAGPGRVASVLLQAGRWVPVILALEIVQLSSDFFALRSILGERWRHVPFATWVRAMAIPYAMMSVLPAGRAAGEVTRATLFSKYVGTPRAATTVTRMQAAYLTANAVLSIVAFSVVASVYGIETPLALLLAGNVVFQTAIASGLLAILRHARIGRWLDRVRRRFVPGAVESPPLDPEERKRVPWRAMLICTAGRAAQVVQYAFILHAVGGTVTLDTAFVAHGIHLVGASLGDLMPNQLGVTDGMYRAFARVLGFADEPARALSIAFVVRIAQLSLTALCVLVAALTRQSERRDGLSPTSARADARS
jgi:hypothetical protein